MTLPATFSRRTPALAASAIAGEPLRRRVLKGLILGLTITGMVMPEGSGGW